MKSVRMLTFAALALAAAPVLSAAQFGVRAGRYHEADENFVGAEMLFDVGAINVNPNIEYSLAEDVTAGSANVDVTYDLANIASFTPYVGAGVGLSYLDTDTASTSTDIVGNLIGGVTFHLSTLTPYAQVKFLRVLDKSENGADAEDDIALTIGLRF